MITALKERIDEPQPQSPAAVPAFIRSRTNLPDGETSSLSVCTLVIWLTVLTVGVMGIYLPYSHPAAPAKEAPAMQAELLNVELTTEETSPLEITEQPLTAPEPPPLAERFIAPEAPSLISVAEPSAAIAFALPVNAPSRIVAAKDASYATPLAVNTTANASTGQGAAPVFQPLTLGKGDGKQPRPEYPWQARREGQEGIVTVHFTIGEDGRVLSAEAAIPSPWKLLNEAALRVIRERWHFRPGPIRLKEVSFHFRLTK
jgi:protein TonB